MSGLRGGSPCRDLSVTSPPFRHTLTSRSSLPRVARPWSPEPAGVKRESRENRERTRRRKACIPASFMCHWQREGRKPGAEPEYLPWTVAAGRDRYRHGSCRGSKGIRASSIGGRGFFCFRASVPGH